MYIQIVAYAFISFVVFAAGCARVPEPASYDYSIQQKMQAGQHWGVLARDVANQINNVLIFSDHIHTPVFVRPSCGNDDEPCEQLYSSVFDQAFRDLLITNLVNLGVPTSAEPTGDSIIVHYKAQPVYHNAARLRTIRPGLLTTLSAGIIVMRNAPWEIAVMAASGGIDALNAAYNSMDRFEVLITTSMISNSEYLYRNTSMYYINSEDSWHYNANSGPTTIRLTAGPDHRSAAPAPEQPADPAPVAAEPPAPPAADNGAAGI